MSQKLEQSLQSGPHAELAKLAGTWTGTTKVWFEPSEVADESPVEGVMRAVLGGRFILHEYKGSFGGKPLEGLALYGYHLDLKRIQSVWVDSFHNGTAIMLSEGKRGTEDLSMLGGYTYITPEEEQHWGWRTEIEITGSDEVRLTSFNVNPAGEEQKATETVYRRVNI